VAKLISDQMCSCMQQGHERAGNVTRKIRLITVRTAVTYGLAVVE
jgi:hypothetical protein